MKHETGCFMAHKSGGKGLGRLKMVPKSVVGMFLGRLTMKHAKRGCVLHGYFPRVKGSEGFGKAQNEA